MESIAIPIAFQVLLFLSLGVAFILGSTWIITTLRFYAHLRKLANGKDKDRPTEPLALPYAVPWLGNYIGLLIDQASFWAKMKKTLGPNHQLCTTRMGPAKCYIITGGQNIQAIFKMSRHLSTDPIERQILKSVFHIPDRDIDIVQQPARDDKGKATDMGKRNRKYDIEKIYENFLLAPRAVNMLTRKFLDVFGEALDQAPEILPLPEANSREAEWATVNFYEWLKDHMFTASTTAFLGSRVLEMNPDLAKDLWTLDEQFLNLVYGLPRFLARSGHEARDRLVNSASRWLDDAHNHGNIENSEDWDPYFGSRFFREKEKMDQKMGLDTKSRAGIKLAFLFAISSNAIPATGWMLLHILTSPTNILSRILSELRSCLLPNDDNNNTTTLSIAIPDLLTPTRTPLLHSLYTETLRYHVAFSLSRDVKSRCTIDGHLLLPGNTIMAPSWMMHRNNDLWTDPPADIFYPERFLATDEKTGEVSFSTAATGGGRYFPYGGGAHICPGRVFAKQEILAAVARVLVGFEFEFVDWVETGTERVVGKKSVDGRGFPGHKKGSMGLGVMAMEWDARVRVRRRMLGSG
ncbi:hypothetical protein GJ744_007650 [Endocarpon pusillum]|uniref:Cytochrome P450 n=1 Tax=Endocarpon pusillum TaxID=364733 RepID=A0A8H7AKG9_9EURO|nr:hypothetical protein GJ744_007650 [Endocarpon pusillum]